MADERRLVCEHFLQTVNDLSNGVGRQTTEPLHQSFRIDRADLVERNEAGPLLKPAWNPPKVRLTTGGHWCHNRRAYMLIKLVRRHDDTRASLADFTAERGIQSHEVHVPAGESGPSYHCHSFSKRVAVGWSSSLSSP